MDVFISYSRQDSPFVARLVGGIESGGKTVWVDTAGIEDTDVFPLAIRRAIEACHAFLFVISPASTKSRYCEQEVRYSLSLNKRLVPVLLAPVPDREVPEPIRERSWIPFVAEPDFDRSLERVLTALDTDLEHRRSHTRWLMKAIEWDKEQKDRSLLLRGKELSAAEAWLARTTGASDPTPTALQQEYLRVSRQGAARRNRRLASSSLGVTILAVALLVFALISRAEAVHEQMYNTVQALAVESQSDLTIDPEASVILAIRAVKDQPTPEAMLALREALDISSLRASLPNVATASCAGQGPSVAFRPGTDEIAENACGAGIRIADTSTGAVIRQLSPISRATVMSYSPTGSVLAVGTRYGLTLLDPASGAVVRQLPYRSTGGPTSLSFNPSGTMLGLTVFGRGGAGAIRSVLFDVKSGREVVLKSPASFNDTSLTFTSDGRFAVVGTTTGMTSVFDMKGRLVRALRTGPPSRTGLPSYVAASPVGSLLAVAVNTDTGSNKVEIWSTRTWKPDFDLTRASFVQYSDLSFSPDGTLLALAEANGAAGVWVIQTTREIVPLLGESAAINSIVFSSDGRDVATASDDGTARVWRATGPELTVLYLGGNIDSIALSLNTVIVVSGYRSHLQVSEWRTSGRELHHFLIPQSSPYDASSVSPDGRYVADVADVACASKVCSPAVLRVFSATTGRLVHSYPTGDADTISWSPDDRQVALTAGRLELISLANGKAIDITVPGAERCGRNGPPAFSADSSLVAWGTRCGNVVVFRTTGKPVSSFLAPGEPSHVAFNPTGTEVAVSSWSGAIGIWAVRRGDRAFALRTASSGMSSTAFSPDGRYLVTTLVGQSAQVWAVATRQLSRVDSNSAPILIAPVFNPTGSTFATGDSAGTVKLWATCPACGDPGLMLHLAAKQVVSKLTTLEQLASR